MSKRTLPRDAQGVNKITEETETELKEYEALMRARRERVDAEAWELAEEFMEWFGDRSILKTRLQSIRMFVDKIGLSETTYAMRLAMQRTRGNKAQRFKYFCGVCWNKIKANLAEEVAQ